MTNSTKGKLLIALEEPEIKDFLPEPMFKEILEMYPDHYYLDTNEEFSDVPEKYAEAIRTYKPEIILSGWTTPSFPDEFINTVPNSLKYYCHLGGSVRRLFSKEIIERGLIVTNWGNAISESVAECALFHTLACLRHGTRWAIGMHNNGAWRCGRYEENYSLLDRTVGLHGFGVISQSLTEMLRPFRAKVSAYSPSVPDELFEKKGVARSTSLEDLFSNNDIVVELAPNKPENFHIVDERILRMLRPGSCFVNVGRGAVVDTEALIKVAKEGKIQVGLDVYEKEPLPADSPLRSLINVNMTPHLGGPTRDQRYRAGEVAFENLRCYKEGKELQNIVNARVYDRIT